MTYPEAIALRLRSLNRQPVDAEQLRQAKELIARTRDEQKPREQEAAK